MRKILNCMNGWQRLWFVSTCCFFIYVAILYPYFQIYQFNMSSYEYRENVIKDIEGGNCDAYINKPIVQLEEPKFESEGGQCYYLYNTRKFDEKDIYPYSIDTYDSNTADEKRKDFFLGFIMFGIGSLIISSFVYFLGFLINWIKNGFYKKENK